jgi:hypothetical protein
MIQRVARSATIDYMPKRKVNIGGNEFMAEEIEFESIEGEKWNKYLLHDGTELKLKAIVAEILRVEGQFQPNGDPVYTVNASVVVNTNAPEQLKRKQS